MLKLSAGALLHGSLKQDKRKDTRTGQNGRKTAYPGLPLTAAGMLTQVFVGSEMVAGHLIDFVKIRLHRNAHTDTTRVVWLMLWCVSPPGCVLGGEGSLGVTDGIY